ncbi:hypothetical protein HMI54_008244 [Coelomomyces lativittatus]|nr:hypothetical protein HMI55_002665 [Coelomomyces lativittatus]KAJ1503288.1 hypothetical protein HMI54_008244 [Coelomomyces lativittatus]KAJ1507985.1 hypothetical protein HMI56_007517 [Coelomomyces lativittatus]
MNLISLLRQTKLARFDPTLNQVYQATASGHWGTKARIPSRLPSSYLTFQHLDSTYKVPLFRLADQKVNAMNRFQELFPSRIPSFVNLLEQSSTNLALLSKPAFYQFCLSPHRSLNEWKKQLRNEWKVPELKGPIFQRRTQHTPWLVYGRPVATFERKTYVLVAGYLGVALGNEYGNRPSLNLYQVHKIVWTQFGTPYIELSLVKPPFSSDSPLSTVHRNQSNVLTQGLMNLLKDNVVKLFPEKNHPLLKTNFK